MLELPVAISQQNQVCAPTFHSCILEETNLERFRVHGGTNVEMCKLWEQYLVFGILMERKCHNILEIFENSLNHQVFLFYDFEFRAVCELKPKAANTTEVRTKNFFARKVSIFPVSLLKSGAW